MREKINLWIDLFIKASLIPIMSITQSIKIKLFIQRRLVFNIEVITNCMSLSKRSCPSCSTWKLCSISGAQTPSASVPTVSWDINGNLKYDKTVYFIFFSTMWLKREGTSENLSHTNALWIYFEKVWYNHAGMRIRSDPLIFGQSDPDQ